MNLDTSALPDLAAFAAANGLSYDPTSAAPAFGGSVFEFLSNATVTDRFASTSGPRFEVGNLTGTVGGAQSRQKGSWTVTTSYSTTETRSYGYMAMQLERALPQLVLDSRRNDGLFGSSVPMPIAGGQRLSLEGDFDTHFLLYAPKGYERDALYVFAPDLMALLIDETGDYDVEIVDDMLFDYSTTPLNLGDAAVWDRLARIRTTVGAKAITQTDLYADDRSDVAGVVGERGQRLVMGFAGKGSGGSGQKMLWIVLGVFVGVIVIVGVVGAIVLNAVFSR